MGRVYSGEKAGYGQVAVKVPIAPEFESMLEAESNALKQVDHPNIVPYIDWISYDKTHALVMGYVGGASLEERFGQSPLTQAEIDSMVHGIAEGLASAHRAGVVHRDLKPSNIKLRDDGQPVLLDFGAAATLDAGQLDPVGTLSYMSPEQVLGEPASPASDQFSFGVVLYEAIAGRRPFTGYHAAALEYEICNEDPPPLHEVDTAISPPLSLAVQRLMAKEPADRYPSLEAFLVEWDEAQEIHAGSSAQSRIVIAASVLDNETGDPTEDFIGRALNDAVVNKLRDLSGVVLVARETVAAQEKAQRDKLKAAAVVGAGYLACGRYLVLGDQMQITAEVVSVGDQEIVWSAQYRGFKADLFEFQDRVAAEVAAHFKTLVPEQVEEVEEKAGPNPEAYRLYREARELYYQGGRENLDRAMETCEQAVELDETFGMAQACLADCYVNMYMWRIDPRPIWLDRGERAAQKALKMDDRTPAAYRALGRVYQHRREHEKAIEFFEKAIEVDPKYAEAMCSLGWVYSERKQFDAALHWANEALKVNPGVLDASLLRGLTYLDQRNYANAERTFRDLNRLYPDYSRGHLYRGEVLQKQGRFAEAREAYEVAQNCSDFDPESFRDLGRVEIYLGQLDDARETFMRAIESEIFEFAAHYYLGLVSKLQGDDAGAQTSWLSSKLLAERMVARDPRDQYARLFSGLAKAALGDRTAYDDIQSVRSQEPDNGEMAYFEARAAQMLGDLDQAEACVFEATQLALGPSHAEYSADPHFKIDWPRRAD